jgi:MFS family permease
MNYSATFAIAFILSLYLQYIKGMNPLHAGIILVFQPIVMAVFSPIFGRLSDKVQPRFLASSGMALTAIGLYLLAFIDQDTSVVYIALVSMLVGFGLAMFSSPNTNALMSSVTNRYYGVASATLGTMRLTGQMLSMATIMLIFALLIGKVQITAGSHSAFIMSAQITFIVFSLVCLIGVFPSMARGKVKRT